MCASWGLSKFKAITIDWATFTRACLSEPEITYIREVSRALSSFSPTDIVCFGNLICLNDGLQERGQHMVECQAFRCVELLFPTSIYTAPLSLPPDQNHSRHCIIPNPIASYFHPTGHQYRAIGTKLCVLPQPIQTMSSFNSYPEGHNRLQPNLVKGSQSKNAYYPFPRYC